jgi:hypothetical protein
MVGGDDESVRSARLGIIGKPFEALEVEVVKHACIERCKDVEEAGDRTASASLLRPREYAIDETEPASHPRSAEEPNPVPRVIHI